MKMKSSFHTKLWAVALVLAFFRRSLLTVALSACGAALLTQCLIQFLL